MSVDRDCIICGCEDKVSEGVYKENDYKFICGACAYDGGNGEWDFDFSKSQWYKKTITTKRR